MTDTTTVVAAPLRVAVSDGDTGFVQVLGKRLDRLGWEHVVLTGAVPVQRLVAMRLGAFIIDLAMLGPARVAVSREGHDSSCRPCR